MPPVPPAGSKISVSTVGADEVIVIPHVGGSIMRYLVGLFMLFWLGGWSFGFIKVGSEVLSGKANLFAMLWLGAWTVGGLMAVYFLYRLIRPSIPETLTLRANSLVYDSGIAPAQMHFGYANQKEAWNSIFGKRTIVELDKEALRSLQLRDTDFGNRLTVDAGNVRLDLARSATEVEREWLAQILKDRYR